MTNIALFEAKNRLSELIDRVQDGEEFVITRRGKVVARLPVDSQAQRGLSAYGAVYLELALRRALPLATQDKKLLTAMVAAGVPPADFADAINRA